MKKFFVFAAVFTAMFLMVSCGGSDSNSITYPWTDPDTNLTWSSLKDGLSWDEAGSYCNSLNEGGYSDWHLPTIDELRTLIQNCPENMTGGSCQVSAENNCLSMECASNCRECQLNETGYSKLGDEYWLCSSSTLSENPDLVWYLTPATGSVIYNNNSNCKNVRCVR